MPCIDEVPLPYHMKVAGYVEETGEILLDTMNQLGEWARKTIDRAQFQAITGGTDATFWHSLDQEWEAPLVIDHLGNCNDGLPHNHWECHPDVVHECHPISDEEYGDIDDLFDEYCPVVILNEMPRPRVEVTTTYGDISPRVSGAVIREMFERANSSILMKKFGEILKNNFSGSQNTGKKKTIRFRRFGFGTGQKEKATS